MAAECQDELHGDGFPARLSSPAVRAAGGSATRGDSRPLSRRKTSYGKDPQHLDAVEKFVEKRLSTGVTNSITGGHGTEPVILGVVP